MSQLSKFFGNKRYLIEEAVHYLENKAVTLTNEQKAAFVVDLMKKAHIAVGGVWGQLLEQAVLMAIDYELSRFRERTQPPETIQPGLGGSIYATPVDGVLPSDEELIKRGFKTGDIKYINTSINKWMVFEAGDSIGVPGWTQAGVIGG